jgi:hypothetical protein
MKIYSYIRMNINGDILEEVSCEYNGFIAECKGDIELPGPTEEEAQLTKSIFEQLTESRKLQEQFLPLVMGASGYKYDENDDIVKMPYDEYLDTLDPVVKQQFANLSLIQERTQQALKGELAANPALEQGLSKQRQQLQEDLARRLGPNWALSSAGIQANQAFEQSAESLRNEANLNAINQYANLGYQGNQLYGLTPTSQMNQMAGIPNYNADLVPQFTTALQPYMQQRQLELQTIMQNQNSGAQASGSIGSALGSVVGGIAGWYLGGPTGAALGAGAGSSVGGGRATYVRH